MNIPFDLKRVVFVISTRTEALGLALVAGNQEVHNVIYVEFPGFMENNNFEIIKRILSNTKIKNLHTVSLKYYYNQINKLKLFKCLRECKYDKRIIIKFDKSVFDGRLFDSDYIFVCLNHSPFISLSNCNMDKVYLMDHAPIDASNRVRRYVKEEHPEIKRNFFNKICYAVTNIDEILRKLNNKIVGTVYPNHARLLKVEKGFTWIKNDRDPFMYLDFRNYHFTGTYSPIINDLKNAKTALLLVDHPEMFRDVPDIYKEVKEVDHCLLYADYVEQSLDKDVAVICKVHPYILEVLSYDERNKYLESIRNNIMQRGYSMVYFFQDLFEDPYEAMMPAEIFIKELKIDIVLGTISSVMEIVQSWPGVRVISNVGRFKFAQEIINEKKRFMEPVEFEVINSSCV